MAEGSLVKVDEPQIECISLGKILDAFNGPLNEEQAWALCHQSAKFLELSLNKDGDKKDFNVDGIESVSMFRDGTVSVDEQEVAGDNTDEQLHQARERELVDALGRVIYQSLDFGFNAEEERELSQPLESLIDSMTISDDTDDKNSDTLNSDEGIEDGIDEEEERNDGKVTNFKQLLKTCRQHISDPHAAENHYQAVCRALVNEVQELTTFLERIATTKKTLKVLARDRSARDDTDGNVEELQPRQWARIWMMVLQNLRQGVQLKKVTEKRMHDKTPIEFELTPYEILMDDIRTRRYQLNKIMVNGDIPTRVKKEAHDIILDFIRSRPPLRPVRCHSWSDAKLLDRPERDTLRKISRHERLLEEIKAKPQLLPVSQRVLAKKPKLRSRYKRKYSSWGDSSSMSSDIDSEDSFEDSPELPKRKLKAEVILDWSDDDDMLETLTIPSSLPAHYHSDTDVFKPPPVKDNMYVYPERPKDPDPATPRPKPTIMPRPPAKKLSAIHLPSLDSDPGTPEFSSLPPGVTGQEMLEAMEEIWLDNAQLLDDEPLSPMKAHKEFIRDDPRRHSIGGCQSQRRSLMRKSKSTTPTTEFNPTPAHLSLTVDEVIHIRTVLVKAELENLRVTPKLYQAVSAEKVCFACKNKFMIFKKKLKCKLCQRLVCSVCCKKMHLPRGHFLQIPVNALSPATPKRRRKNNQSDYRGPETAERYRSISEPPTPSISPIHIPKFWRTETSTADGTDDVCVLCKDFLLNALKSAQKTPTPSPNRTPIRTPSMTPSRTSSGSEQSTPTRRFSLGPAPHPPGLYRKTDQDEFENSANQSKENGLLPKDNSRKTLISRWNNNDMNDYHVIEDIECMTICDGGPDKPWGVNNDDEELEEVRKSAPSQERRIPYII